MNKKYKSLSSFFKPTLWLVFLGLLAYSEKESLNSIVYFILGLTVLMIGFDLYFKIQRYRNEKSGLTPDDELSNRIKEKAAAKAFILSVKIWIIIILLPHNVEITDEIVALGLLAMGLIFFLNWLYYSKVGISVEDKN